MPQQQSKGARWFPTVEQLSTPEKAEQTLRQVLTQFYALTDRLAALEGSKPAAAAPSGPPPGSGPTDSMICGLRVQPIDTNTLNNGAILTYDKPSGQFKFV